MLVHETNYIWDDWKQYLSFAINTNSISLWNSVPKICETIVLCGSIVLINYFTFKYIIERKPLINKTHLMVELL